MLNQLCHCGKPLHYTNPDTQRMVQNMIDLCGEYCIVTVRGRSWRVQRHYIALHGLKAAEMDQLGFEEAKTAQA